MRELFDQLFENAKIFGSYEIVKLVNEHKLTFYDVDHVQEFLDLIQNAHNNTRMWQNKGHTPNELIEHKDYSRPEMVVRESRKIGSNEPCPCGSGKKFKKCCRLKGEAKTARLSDEECMLFYATWHALLNFVNAKEKVLSADVEPFSLTMMSDEELLKVRNVLWEKPRLIGEFITVLETAIQSNLPKKNIIPFPNTKNDELAAEAVSRGSPPVPSIELAKQMVELLKSWRDFYKKDDFILIDYTSDYAIFINSCKDKDQLYGVKGMSRSIAEIFNYERPVSLSTVLLPFKNKIVYDCNFESWQVSYGAGATKMFKETYEKAKKNGIITCLQKS
jgi:hypothetical protein